MSVLQWVLVISWFLLFEGSVSFLIFFKWPWRYEDRMLSWHVFTMTLATALEAVALFMTGLSLIPAAMMYVVSAAIVHWRLALLLAVVVRRRRAARSVTGGTADG